MVWVTAVGAHDLPFLLFWLSIYSPSFYNFSELGPFTKTSHYEDFF